MSNRHSTLFRGLWLLLRFSLCSWVGAAVLFVVSVVREVTTPFEMAVKNQLVALRFPVFYAFGFTLLGMAFAISLVLSLLQDRRLKALGAIAVLSGLSLLVMLFDYRRVYLPLEEMVLSPKHVIPPDFFSLHQWSKWVNLVTATLSLIAAVISVWDTPERTPSESASEICQSNIVGRDGCS